MANPFIDELNSQRTNPNPFLAELDTRTLDTTEEFRRKATGIALWPSEFTAYGNEGTILQPEDFETSLDLTSPQRRAERAARTETRRGEARVRRSGLQEEYEDYLADEEPGGMMTALDPIFDVLQSANFAVAGATAEYLRTNSAWEAFKQAGIEFAAAMPFTSWVDDTFGTQLEEKAKETTFSTILSDGGNGRWTSAIGGFLLDVVLDPLTYVSPAAFLKVYGKIARPVASGAAKLAPHMPGATAAINNTVDVMARLMVPNYGLKQLGPAGEVLMREQGYARAAMEDGMFHIQEVAERLAVNTTEAERRLIGLYLDQPTRLADELKALADAGHIPQDRIPELLEKAKGLETEFKRIFSSEVEAGVIDKGIWRENYIYGVGPSTARSQRAMDKMMRERGISTRLMKEHKPGTLIRLEETAGFTERKTYATLEERVMAGVPTEIDYALNYAQRGIAHVRAMANKRLIDAVVNDPSISARVIDVDMLDQAGALERFIASQGGKASKTQIADFRKGLKESTAAMKAELKSQGYDIFQVKRSGETVAAYALPDEIIKGISNTEQIFQRPEELNAVLRTFDKLQSMWKGYAVLSPGFHFRNMYSNWFQNYLAGVGRVEGKGFASNLLTTENLPGFLRSTGNRILGNKVETSRFIHRHMQALKLQALGEQLPDGVRKAMEKASNLSFRDVKIPEIRWSAGAKKGQVMSAEDILEAARAHGVMGRGIFVADMGEEVQTAIIRDLDLEVVQGIKGALSGKQKRFLKGGEQAAGAAGLDPLASAVVRHSGSSVDIANRASRYFGSGSPLLRANRAVGRTVEHNARMALFLDRLIKGESVESSAAAVKKYLFDYGELTAADKEVFKRLIPFWTWCVPDDCEIMTKEGWKTVDQLSVGEDVLSLDHEKGTSEWAPCEEVATFDYDGVLMTIQNQRDEFLFTPDHRWPVVNQVGKREIRRGYELRSNWKIPRTSEYLGGENSPSEHMAAIVGWLVTDGYMRCRPRSPNHVEMVIYQSPGKHLQQIKDLLGKCGSVGKPHPDTGVVPVRIIGKLRAEVQAALPNKAAIIGFVASLDRKAAEACMKAMIDAEGSTGHVDEEKGREFAFFSQNHGPVLDAFQLLAQQCGMVAHVTARGAYISRSNHHLKVAGAIGHTWYSGRVWCPVTKHGTWLMRRKGRVIWTGNTRKNIPLQFQALATNPGQYAKIPKLMGSIESMSKDWEGIPESDYFRELHALRMPITRRGKPIYLNPNLPFQDLNRANMKDVMSSLTPFLKAPFELVPKRGYSLFLDRPIEAYKDEPSTAIPAMMSLLGIEEGPTVTRKTEQMISTALPTIGKALRLAERKARGELTEQVLTEGLGIKLIPNDVRRVTRGKTFARRRLLREFRRKAASRGIDL